MNVVCSFQFGFLGFFLLLTFIYICDKYIILTFLFENLYKYNLNFIQNINLFFILFYFIYLFFFVVNFVIHWHEKALGSHVVPIPIPPPTSLPTRSLQVLPEHQGRAIVSCIQPGPVICFTLDSIHVSMLFSWNIPPSPSPTESKRLFYKSVSLFLFCIELSLTSF